MSLYITETHKRPIELGQSETCLFGTGLMEVRTKTPCK